jgi:hypothetical protein
MDEITKAYLAGCLDCDGWFTIKRSTYALRVRGDATQAVYSERIGLKQVTEDVPRLLCDSFGGYLRMEKPSAKNGKPLWAWSVSDRKAIGCVNALLPYLRVKRQQAEVLLALRGLKELPRVQRGTFAMTNQWGSTSQMPRRFVDPEVITRKEGLFNHIKSLNDSRPTKPRLI